MLVAQLPSPISVAFTVAGNEPLLVGWLKLKANGGGVEVVVVVIKANEVNGRHKIQNRKITP